LTTSRYIGAEPSLSVQDATTAERDYETRVKTRNASRNVFQGSTREKEKYL